MGDWIILRTKGRQTLSLARSLAEDGFEVWTPARTKIIHIPKHNARREVTLPILASFLFARSAHLIDLLQLAELPVKPRRGAGLRQPAHPDFSVFHYGERIPLVSESELAGLRALEAKLAVPILKRKAKPYARGDLVRMDEGSFAGMTGVVQSSSRGVAEVCFGGRHTVKINAFILQPVALEAARMAA